MDCIFCKIIRGEIPAQRVYEDDDMIIINDIAPQAERHYLMIPKQHYANIIEMTDAEAVVLGKCLKKLSLLTPQLGLSKGFRLVSNCGVDACQTVGHLHVHILGGQQLSGDMG